MSAETFSRGASYGARVIAPKGLVVSGLALAVGAGTSFGAQMLVENTEIFAKYWYGPALFSAFVGHLAKSAKNMKVAMGGMSMLGAAGAMGYYSYKLHDATAKANGETTGVQDADTGAPADDYVNALRSLPQETSGVQDMPVRRANPLSNMRTAAAA